MNAKAHAHELVDGFGSVVDLTWLERWTLESHLFTYGQQNCATMTYSEATAPLILEVMRWINARRHVEASCVPGAVKWTPCTTEAPA